MVRLLIPLLAAASLAAGCGGESETASGNPDRPAQPSVRDITNVLALRAEFNADRGKPRLLLILSPT